MPRPILADLLDLLNTHSPYSHTRRALPPHYADAVMHNRPYANTIKPRTNNRTTTPSLQFYILLMPTLHHNLWALPAYVRKPLGHGSHM